MAEQENIDIEGTRIACVLLLYLSAPFLCQGYLALPHCVKRRNRMTVSSILRGGFLLIAFNSPARPHRVPFILIIFIIQARVYGDADVNCANFHGCLYGHIQNYVYLQLP